MSNRLNTPLITGLLLALAACGSDPDAEQVATAVAPAEERPAYVVLDDSLAQLKADFNGNKGKVRLLFIVGDTCGICLRGMADLNDAFLARAQADDRLLTLVVHVPVLGAEERHIPEAMQLLDGPRVNHYWDGSGISGKHLIETLDTDGVYAWDVWLAYGSGTEWTGDIPPKPDFWMHQLGPLDRELRLDAGKFGDLALELMQDVSTSELVERKASQAELLADGAVISSVAQPKGTAIGGHIQGRGGYQALKSMQSVQRQGEIISGAGSTRIRITADRETGLLREYNNPDQGLPTELEASLAETWEFDGKLIDWKDKGHKVRISGMRKISSSLAWKLFLLQSNGARWVVYIDSHTGDQVLQERLDDRGQVMFSVAASDFTEIDGTRWPNTIEYRDANGEQIATERFEETRIGS